MYYKPFNLENHNLLIKYLILQGNSIHYPAYESSNLVLHYVLKGNFIIKFLSQEAYVVLPKECVFIAKQNNNYILNSNEVYSTEMITFLINREQFDFYFRKNLNNKGKINLFLQDQNASYAILKNNSKTNIQDNILTKSYSDLKNGINISQNKLYILLCKILKTLDYNYDLNSNIPAAKPKIEDILEYIRNNHATVNLKVLSQKYNYSISYISELIHKETGLTFSQTLKTIRMSKSLELLTTTNKTVNEISKNLGYASTPGFITAFQETYNMTPSEYRRNNINLI